MRIAIIFEKYSLLLKVAEYFDAFAEKNTSNAFAGYCFKKTHEYFLFHCVGCSHTHNTLHLVNAKKKIDVVVRIGTCGVTDTRFELGDVLLVGKSINQDAISKKYFSDVIPQADKKLLNYIADSLLFKIVDVYTVDAIWEKPPQGTSIIDMETSALYSYCNYHKLKALSISVCRDNTKKHLKNEEVNDILISTIKSVLNTLETEKEMF